MVIQKGDTAATHFIEVDLDIYSARDLQPIVTTLSEAVSVLHVGRIKRTYSAHLELVKLTKTADKAIKEFCALLKSLPRAERQLWNTAKIRDFNIGVQAGAQPFCTEFALSSDTVRAASDLGARIVFTVYATEKARRPLAGARAGAAKVGRAIRHNRPLNRK
jgi:hypothetical protein